MAIFNVARGHYEQKHFAKSQFDVRPLAFGLGFASIPFFASVALKKPNVFLGASLIYCTLDYAYDRWNVSAVGPETLSR